MPQSFIVFSKIFTKKYKQRAGYIHVGHVIHLVLNVTRRRILRHVTNDNRPWTFGTAQDTTTFNVSHRVTAY